MQRSVVWACWSEPGLEYLHLAWQRDAITASSYIIGMAGGTPFRAQSVIRCDTHWRLAEVTVTLLSGDGRGQVLRMKTDGAGHWSTPAGDPVPELDGCLDVDISVTPFTNTLPIRRLALQPGVSTDLLVAYIDLPALTVAPKRQRYTCLSLTQDGGRYLYESVPSGFTAELPVDADGLVLDYPGMFRRIWPLP